MVDIVEILDPEEEKQAASPPVDIVGLSDPEPQQAPAQPAPPQAQPPAPQQPQVQVTGILSDEEMSGMQTMNRLGVDRYLEMTAPHLVKDKEAEQSKGLQSFKTLTSSAGQMVLNIAESIWDTPGAASRWAKSGETALRDNGVPDALNPFSFPAMVFDVVDKGIDFGDYHAAGTGDVADSITNAIEILPELSPTFARLGMKNEEAAEATVELIEGNPELMKSVVKDPEAWAAFIGNGLPTLYAAWKSGGSLTFMGWLEAMDQARSIDHYEKLTGEKISDAQFAISTAAVGAINAFLEKAGLDAIFKGNKGGKLKLLKRFVGGLIGEGGTEGTQEITQNIAALVYDEDLQQKGLDAIEDGEWEPFLQEMAEGTVPAIMGGAGIGGGVGVARGGLETMAERANAKQQKEDDNLITPEEADEQGLQRVPITQELLERVATGDPMTEDEMYSLIDGDFATFIDDTAERMKMKPKGRAKLREVRQTAKETAVQIEAVELEGEKISTTLIHPERGVTLEGDQAETLIAPDIIKRGVSGTITDQLGLVRQADAQAQLGNTEQASTIFQELLDTSAHQSVRDRASDGLRLLGVDTDPTFTGKSKITVEDTLADSRAAVKEAADQTATSRISKRRVRELTREIADIEQILATAEEETPAIAEIREDLKSIKAEKAALGEPTDAQKKAGNYKKGHMDFQGLGVSIENPKGTDRSGTAKGKPWKQRLKSHYGYIKGTMARDGDQLDAFIGEHPTSDVVLVVNQNDPSTGKFDEHKVMLGYNNETAAINGYMENYPANWKGLESYSVLTMEEFKDWISARNMRMPVEVGDITEGRHVQKETGKDGRPRFKRKTGPNRKPRSNEGKGTRVENVQDAIRSVYRHMRDAPPIKVVASFEDLPLQLQRRMNDLDTTGGDHKLNTVGIYDQGVWQDMIYMIANNISSPDEAVENLFHEVVGHYGLGHVIPSHEYDNYMDKVYRSFRAKVNKAAKINGLDVTDQTERRLAAEEFIAYEAERILMDKNRKTDALLMDLVKELVDILKKVVMRMTGRDVFTTGQIHSIIGEAYRYVHGEGGYKRAKKRGVLRSVKAPLWYSQLFKAVNEQMPKKGTPEEYLKQIRGRVKKGKLKAEEVKWSGIEDWLEEGPTWADVDMYGGKLREDVSALRQRADDLAKEQNDELNAHYGAWENAKMQWLSVASVEEKDALQGVWKATNLWNESIEEPTLADHPRYGELSELNEELVLKMFNPVDKLPVETILGFLKKNGTRIKPYHPYKYTGEYPTEPELQARMLENEKYSEALDKYKEELALYAESVKESKQKVEDYTTTFPIREAEYQSRLIEARVVFERETVVAYKKALEEWYEERNAALLKHTIQLQRHLSPSHLKRQITTKGSDEWDEIFEDFKEVDLENPDEEPDEHGLRDSFVEEFSETESEYVDEYIDERMADRLAALKESVESIWYEHRREKQDEIDDKQSEVNDAFDALNSLDEGVTLAESERDDAEEGSDEWDELDDTLEGLVSNRDEKSSDHDDLDSELSDLKDELDALPAEDRDASWDDIEELTGETEEIERENYFDDAYQYASEKLYENHWEEYYEKNRQRVWYSGDYWVTTDDDGDYLLKRKGEDDELVWYEDRTYLNRTSFDTDDVNRFLRLHYLRDRGWIYDPETGDDFDLPTFVFEDYKPDKPNFGYFADQRGVDKPISPESIVFPTKIGEPDKPSPSDSYFIRSGLSSSPHMANYLKQIPGGENYEEIVFEWDNPEETLFSMPGAHFSGPQNGFAHVLFDERKDNEGNTGIATHEWQADWHQQVRVAREPGGRGVKDPVEAKRLGKTLNTIKEKLAALVAPVDTAWSGISLANTRIDDLLRGLDEREGGDDDDNTRTSRRLREVFREIGSNPTAPSTVDADEMENVTKIDLARAYEDMGDPAGAISILKEVLSSLSVTEEQVTAISLNLHDLGVSSSEIRSISEARRQRIADPVPATTLTAQMDGELEIVRELIGEGAPLPTIRRDLLSIARSSFTSVEQFEAAIHLAISVPMTNVGITELRDARGAEVARRERNDSATARNAPAGVSEGIDREIDQARNLNLSGRAIDAANMLTPIASYPNLSVEQFRTVLELAARSEMNATQISGLHQARQSILNDQQAEPIGEADTQAEDSNAFDTLRTQMFNRLASFPTGTHSEEKARATLEMLTTFVDLVRTMGHTTVGQEAWDRSGEAEKLSKQWSDTNKALENARNGLMTAAPFEKNWQIKVLQYLIRQAVERGHKKIWIFPGDLHGHKWGGGQWTRAIKYKAFIIDDEAQAKEHRAKIGDVGLTLFPQHETQSGDWQPNNAMRTSYKEAANFVGMDVADEIRKRVENERLINPTLPTYTRMAQPQDLVRNVTVYEGERTHDQDSGMGIITAELVGRDKIWIPHTGSNSSRMVMIGNRSAYNTLLPNQLNKELKKYKSRMKLGRVATEPTEGASTTIRGLGLKTFENKSYPSNWAGDMEGAYVDQIAQEEVDRHYSNLVESGLLTELEGEEQTLKQWYGIRFQGMSEEDHRTNTSTLPASWSTSRIEQEHQLARWVNDERSGFGTVDVEAWEIEITPEMEKANEEGWMLFSKKKKTGNRKVDDAVEWAEQNIGPKRKFRTIEVLQERLNQVLRIENKLAKMEQGLIDQFAGIKHALREQYGHDLPAELSGYRQAHFTTSADSQMYAFMTQGVPYWETVGKGGTITQIKPGSKGLLEVIEPVAEKIEEWGWWMAARRARRLLLEGMVPSGTQLTEADLNRLWNEYKAKSASEKKAIRESGREHMFTDEAIDGLLELGNLNPVFGDVADEYNAWRSDFLDWAQEAGVLNAETRVLWESADYVPFYRLKADELGGGFSKKAGIGVAGIANQRNPIKRLKGGTQPLGDILENIIINFNQIAQTTMRNKAAAMTVEGLKDSGLITPAKGMDFMKEAIISTADLRKKLANAGIDVKAMPPDALAAMGKMWTVNAPEGDNIVSVLENGKKKYYEVHDETLFRSLTAINETKFSSLMGRMGMWLPRKTKRLLTSAITLAPDFMAANWFRDIFMAFTNSRDAKLPGRGSVSGAIKALRMSDEMVSMMASGGAFYSGYINAMDPAASTKAIKRALRKGGFRHRILDSPMKLFHAYQDIGAAMENANRIGAAYTPAMKAGKGKAEAIWESKDLMNFSKHGDWAVIQFLIQTVPFMNARIQGLVRYGQRFKEAPGETFLKSFLYTLAVFAMWMRNKDEDWYKELTDDDKDMYVHWKVGDRHYRLPKAFEVGSIFGTMLGERVPEYFYSQETDAGKLAMERLGFMIGENFSMNPMPQLIKPATEVGINYNFFFQGKIVSTYYEGMDEDLQYGATTSPAAIELARVMPSFMWDKMKSPKNIEHLVRGYGGTLGGYAMMLSDDLVRAQFDYAPRPNLRWDQFPLVKRFYRGGSDEAPRHTRYESILYEVRASAKQIASTVRGLEKLEREDEIDAYLERPSRYSRQFTNEDILDAAEAMKGNYKAIRDIKNEMNEIWQDRKMSPSQKLIEVNKLYREKADEAEEAYRERPGAGAEERTSSAALIDDLLGVAQEDRVAYLSHQGLGDTATLLSSMPAKPSKSLSTILTKNSL